MNTTQPNGSDFSVTTFDTVVVDKTKLLETLEKNREKHNSIYQAAISGYWIEAQKTLDQKKEQAAEALDKKKTEFDRAVSKFQEEFAYQASGLQLNVSEQNKDKIGGFSVSFDFNSSLWFNGAWPLTYPENHLEDYDRVIDLLKFSVADKVRLSSSDFDAYVRNNWSWRKSFLNTNAHYVGTLYASGCLSPSSYAINSTGMTFGAISVTGCYSPTSFYRQVDSQF